MMGRFQRTGGVWVRHGETCQEFTQRWPQKESRRWIKSSWRSFWQTLLRSTQTFSTKHYVCNTNRDWRVKALSRVLSSTNRWRLLIVWQGQHGTVPASPYLVKAWCNVGGTFPEPFWQPKTDLHLENHKKNAVGGKKSFFQQLEQACIIHVNSFMIALISDCR